MDNSKSFPKSKLGYHKIRPLVDNLNNKFKTVYVHSSFLVADESIIVFKGRLLLKQYMSIKPAKRAYKM